jgi:hypothetical protein
VEPSWTFPIPQAMLQHRGSQVPRSAPPHEMAAADRPDENVGSQAGEDARKVAPALPQR